MCVGARAMLQRDDFLVFDSSSDVGGVRIAVLETELELLAVVLVVRLLAVDGVGEQLRCVQGEEGRSD